MRVHLVHNVCNNHYVLAKYLREIGVDAHLFYDPQAHWQSSPSSEDQGVVSRSSDWLHPIDPPRRRWQSWHAADRRLIRKLAECDILHVHDVGLVWAARTGRPFVWQPHGGDLFQLPFYRGWLLRRFLRVPVPEPRNLLTPLAMRAAMQKASAIVIGWHNRLWRRGMLLLNAYNLLERVHRHHLALNVDKYRPWPRERIRQARSESGLAKEDCGWLIFHPTRQCFTSRSIFGQKGNDRLYDALHRLQRDGVWFTLVLIARGLPDEDRARKRIEALGLTPQVRWEPAMPRERLVRWYNMADVTADQFHCGALGSLPLESMGCGTSVLTHMQTEPDTGLFMDPNDLYAELPPVLNASTPTEIYERLQASFAEAGSLRERGERSRAWIERNVAGPVVAKRYERLYHRLLSGADERISAREANGSRAPTENR